MTRDAHKRLAAVLILVAVAGMGLAGVVLSPGSARRARITGQSAAGAPQGLTVPPPPRERRSARPKSAEIPPSGRSAAPATRATAANDGTHRPGTSARPGPGREPENRALEGRPAPTAPAAPPATRSAPAPTPETGEPSAGFRDRANLGADFAGAINRELFPLASECIELAQVRNPALAGLLAVRLNVIPIDGDRALVASVEPTEANEIDDAELFECVEQSSFAVEGLPRALSFDITMPIEPRGAP